MKRKVVIVSGLVWFVWFSVKGEERLQSHSEKVKKKKTKKKTKKRKKKNSCEGVHNPQEGFFTGF